MPREERTKEPAGPASFSSSLPAAWPGRPRAVGPLSNSPGPLRMPVPAELVHDAGDERLSVAKEHQRLVEVIERVINAGETRVQAALDDHGGARLIHVEDGHAVDGARAVEPRGRIGDVAR